MVRVYPITPQSQLKQNSRATVPLSPAFIRTIMQKNIYKISWHFDLPVCMPDHTMRLIVTLSNYSENPACCQFKVVGGETYRLIHADHGEQTMDVYGCKDDCIYRK